MRRAARLARLARTFTAAESSSAPSGGTGAAPSQPTKPAPHLRSAASLVAATAGLSLPAFWAACKSDDNELKARANIAAAADAVDADVHRAEAGVPRVLLGVPPPPAPPVVSAVGAGKLKVVMTVRKGADAAAVLAALVAGGLTRAAAAPAGITVASDDGACATLLVHGRSGGTVELTAPAAMLASDAGAALVEAVLRAASSVAGLTDGSASVRSWSWSSGDGGTDGLAGILGGVLEGGSPADVLAAVDSFMRHSLGGDGPPHVLRDDHPSILGDRQPGGSIALDPRPPPPPAGAAPKPRGATPADAATAALTGMGCTVTPPPPDDAARKRAFDRLAGYEAQQGAIADALLPLTHASECAAVVAAARAPAVLPGAGGAPTPRAILFSGPPGCGKTASAAAAAASAGAVLVVVPVESIVSKWYGEAEQRLAQVFDHARTLAAASPAGVVLFCDEIDSLATSRSDGMHEATRRCLGVLLRSLDGINTGDASATGAGGVVAVLATNRPEDVDPALASRCAARIQFPLPTESERAAILKLYAAHLPARDVAALAAAGAGLSGRDLRDAAETAERRHAAAVVRGSARPGTPPPVSLYKDAVEERAAAVRADAAARRRWRE